MGVRLTVVVAVVVALLGAVEEASAVVGATDCPAVEVAGAAVLVVAVPAFPAGSV